MRHITLVLFVLVSIVATHDGSAGERADKQKDRISIEVDIVVNEQFTDDQAAQVRQATPAGENADAAVQQARHRPFASRCSLWLTYLGRSAPVDKESMKCVETGGDGQTRQGRLTVDILVPKGGTLVENEARRVDFKGGDRYNTWERCHVAAARAQGVVAVCDEAPSARKDNRQFVTTLRVFSLRVKGADADE